MYQPRPIPLAISYGRTDSVKNSGGVLWNCYAETAPESAKTPITLLGSPGQTLFATLDVAPNEGPCCHGIIVNEVVYCCTTKGLYKVKANGSVKKLGAISVQPVARMASNGTDIVIVDGVKSLKYTITGNEDVTPGPITDYTASSSYFPSRSVTAIDSYLVFEAAGTGAFFHTELNSTVIDPFSIVTAEAYPDRAFAVMAHRRSLWVFGSQSIEVWYDAGGTTTAFARLDGTTIAHGVPGPYCMAAGETAIAWLANSGVVYMATGLVPEMISTPAIHDALEGLDLTGAVMCAYVHNGHSFFQLSVGTKTLVYDQSMGLWHGLRDETYGRHRAVFVVNAFSKNLMGDVVLPQLRELTADAFDNVGEPLILDIITPALHADAMNMKVGSFEIELDNNEGSSGNVTMAYSDDDGRTWSADDPRPVGGAGNNKQRQRWNRLGAARSKRFRIKIAASVRRAILSRAFATVR